MSGSTRNVEVKSGRCRATPSLTNCCRYHPRAAARHLPLPGLSRSCSRVETNLERPLDGRFRDPGYDLVLRHAPHVVRHRDERRARLPSAETNRMNLGATYWLMDAIATRVTHVGDRDAHHVDVGVVRLGGTARRPGDARRAVAPQHQPGHVRRRQARDGERGDPEQEQRRDTALAGATGAGRPPALAPRARGRVTRAGRVRPTDRRHRSSRCDARHHAVRASKMELWEVQKRSRRHAKKWTELHSDSSVS